MAVKGNVVESLGWRGGVKQIKVGGLYDKCLSPVIFGSANMHSYV